MNIHDMTEESYKNGYEKGVKDFAEKLRKECHVDSQGFYVVLIDQITTLEEKLVKVHKPREKVSQWTTKDYSFEIGV